MFSNKMAITYILIYIGAFSSTGFIESPILIYILVTTGFAAGILLGIWVLLKIKFFISSRLLKWKIWFNFKTIRKRKNLSKRYFIQGAICTEIRPEIPFIYRCKLRLFNFNVSIWHGLFTYMLVVYCCYVNLCEMVFFIYKK